jgi:hypothetical protein
MRGLDPRIHLLGNGSWPKTRLVCEGAMDPRVKPAGDTREIVNQISWKTLLRPYELGCLPQTGRTRRKNAARWSERYWSERCWPDRCC